MFVISRRPRPRRKPEPGSTEIGDDPELRDGDGGNSDGDDRPDDLVDTATLKRRRERRLVAAEASSARHVVYYNRMTHVKTTKMPAALDNFIFPRLVNLDVSNNRLTELPPAVLRHPLLKRLNLAHNRLVALPMQFVGRPFDEAGTRGRVYLTSLTSLRFAGNRIKALPMPLFNLPQLTDLDCSINRVMALPPQVSMLRKLRRLWINSNVITALPANLDKLTQLQDLKLHSNPLVDPPYEEAIRGVRHVFRWCREQYHLRKHGGRPPARPALITYGPAKEISILQPAQMKRMVDSVEAAKKTHVFNLHVAISAERR